MKCCPHCGGALTAPPTISIAEVARVLGVTPRHVRTLVAEGVIPGTRLGSRGRWRVLRSWLYAHEAEVSEQSEE